MGHSLVSSSSLVLVPMVLLFSLFQSPTEAIQKSYIVYMGAHSHGPNPTSIDLETATSSHYAMLSTYKGSEEKAKESMLYSYNTYINGFAAVLDDAEATEIAKHPNVLSVFENKPKKLHTTHTWDFLELEKNGVVSKSSLWKKARFGENTIIGNLDTGAWPESKSFSDDGIGPIPSKWKGVCQDDNNDKFRCNRKLIGARYFNKGYLAYLKLVNGTMSPLQSKTISSPRDTFGHGTHTLSTAGGNFVPGANVFNNGNGTAKGGSPKARVAVYKVCWDGDMCFDSDILAGFEAAIADGVDVLSVSLGGAAVEYFQEGIAIGSFHAVKHGLTVIASAGNDGPSEQTVANTAPWLITVGASTIDREFTAPVTLGNGKILKGQSLSSIPLPSKNMFPLLTGADAKLAKANASEALLCKPNTLDPKKAKGKILVCLRGDNARIEKGQQAALAGAIGMILANTITDGNDVIADPHYLPASHLNYNDANLLFSYLKSTKSPLAHIAQATTLFDVKQSPSMAGFSSRGPSFIEPSILKPDITAPGVNIIAAYSEATAPTDVETDRRRVPFNVDSGTSMACPHVSGVVGLLKTLYPNWSAAAIKSAIMTTARTRDGTKKPILDSDMKKATPFAYGAGHIHPNRAMNPGLVYDMETHDYLNFLCARGYNATTIKLFAHKPYNCPKSFSLVNLNYPSISIPKLGKRTLVVTRRVKNVGGPGIYKALLRAPAGVSVYVKPAILNFDKVGEEKTFEIVFKANVVGKPKTYTFGELKWSDGKHIVRSPIAVKF